MTLKSLERSCYIYRDIWSSKNVLLPKEVAISSAKKIWFDCHTCNHSYEQTPGKKTNSNRGCPYCAIPSKKLCGSLNCVFCLNRSCVIYNEIWSSKNNLRSEEVSLNSHKKYWFNCKVCPHDYEQSPDNKTRRDDGCPYCAVPSKKLCGLLDCTFCLPRSCYIYRKTWCSRNESKPGVVAISSNTKYWFDCYICNHSYEQRPSDKTNHGQGCSYCSGNKLCGTIECNFCLPKSCYIYRESWSVKNTLRPEDVAISSGKKILVQM
jgi:hypothetical protein